MSAGALVAATPYVFTLKVTSNATGLWSTISVTVTATTGVSAAVSINVVGGFQASGAYYVPPNASTRLVSSVNLIGTGVANVSNAYTFFWSCVGTPCLDLTDTAVASTGNNKFTLVLQPGVLAAGVAYTFQLRVNTTNPAGIGLGSVVVTAFQLPTAGIAVVSPSSATLGTTFVLSAAGFSDPVGAGLLYNFYLQGPNDTSALPLLPTAGSSQSALVSILPVGTVAVRVAATDATGTTVYSAPTYFNVTSSGATATAYVNMVNAALDRAISSGDLASILAIIRVASLVCFPPTRAPEERVLSC